MLKVKLRTKHFCKCENTYWHIVGGFMTILDSKFRYQGHIFLSLKPNDVRREIMSLIYTIANQNGQLESCNHDFYWMYIGKYEKYNDVGGGHNYTKTSLS